VTAEAINRRILVVDDSEESHHAYAAVLTTAVRSGELDQLADLLFEDAPAGAPAQRPTSQFEMHRATQGQEGAEMVRESLANQRPYALAFVDMRMPPGWDGVRTTREIWAIDPRVEIVICTAYMDHEESDILTLGEATDQLLFLRKPFAGLEVAQMARSLTRKWSLRDSSERAQGSLARQQQQVEEHQRTIAALSAPMLEVDSGVVAVPIIGELDGDRGARLLESLLGELKRRRAHTLILDLTGLSGGEGSAVQGLHTIARASALLGIRCLVSGIHPELAMATAALQEATGTLRTTRTLAQAIRLAQR
jgi:anti-anti-sigma regulatory factor